jgi:hypothetical protein
VIPAIVRRSEQIGAKDQPFSVAPRALGTVALVLMLVASIMQIAARSYNPFIYFRF